MGRAKLVGPATSYIAGELRAQRARHGWTYDDLAEMSGVARSTIERAMKGETGLTIEVLIRLCDAMEVDVLSLVDQASKAE